MNEHLTAVRAQVERIQRAMQLAALKLSSNRANMFRWGASDGRGDAAPTADTDSCTEVRGR
jgi:hypothetical protein